MTVILMHALSFSLSRCCTCREGFTITLMIMHAMEAIRQP